MPSGIPSLRSARSRRLGRPPSRSIWSAVSLRTGALARINVGVVRRVNHPFVEGDATRHLLDWTPHVPCQAIVVSIRPCALRSEPLHAGVQSQPVKLLAAM